MTRLAKNATGESPALRVGRRRGRPPGTARVSDFAETAIGGYGYARLSPAERAARKEWLDGWKVREAHYAELTGMGGGTGPRFAEPHHGFGSIDLNTDTSDRQSRRAQRLLEKL